MVPLRPLALGADCIPIIPWLSQVAGKIYFAPSKYFRNGYLTAQDLVDATFKVFDTSHKINSLAFGDKYPVRPTHHVPMDLGK